MGGPAKYKTIDDYIQDQPEKTRQMLIELRACIREAAPGAEETFNYQIPAFTLIPGGKRDQQIMMAGYQKHVGLYPHPAVMEHFADDLKDYKQGKGSVQFQLDRPLPKKLIKKMVEYRLNLLTEK